VGSSIWQPKEWGRPDRAGDGPPGGAGGVMKWWYAREIGCLGVWGIVGIGGGFAGAVGGPVQRPQE
jgi:hypothetical protein